MRGSVSNPDFLKLWSAQTITQLGSGVTQLALPLVAILVLDASTFEVAIVTGIQTVPFLLLALPAGVWVDRLRRRPLMIASDLGRALLIGSIPLTYAFDALTLWQLYAVALLVGALRVFFDVAYLSYLPSLVTREQLAGGNAKLEATRAGTEVAGPGAAGGLIDLVGAPAAMTVDAASFGISGALLGLIRRREEVPERASREPMRVELLEGVRYVFRHPLLRPLTITTSAWNIFASVEGSVFLLFAVKQLEWSPALIGVVIMGSSVGSLVGALLSRRVPARFGLGRTITWGAVLACLGFFAAPLTPLDREIAVPLITITGVFGAFMGMLFNVNQLTLRQSITPHRLQGRMNAVVRFMYWGGIPLGAVMGGALGTAIGLRTTMLIGAIGATLSMVPLMFTQIRKLERVPEAEEEEMPPLTPVGHAVPVVDA